jgi:hypothetical protein
VGAGSEATRASRRLFLGRCIVEVKRCFGILKSLNTLDATSRGTAYRLVICDVREANLRRITGEVLLALPENGSHLKAELPRPFSYLLPGFKTRPESFFSCRVKSTLVLSRVNPTKLIVVLAAVA